MFNRPNFGINAYDHTYDSCGGDNNLRREFKDCFRVMLSANYYDYTESGRYYNKFDANGRSVYYVPQPDIECKIEDFYNSPVDEDKFLVGFTGIGKTTLIRNCFKITSANPFIAEDKSLIAYLSVYSDAIETHEDVNRLLSSFLRSVVDCVVKEFPYDLEDKKNQLEFYNYIKSYKNRLLQKTEIFGSKKTEQDKLKLLERKHPVIFYSLLIKYLINLVNKDSKKIKQIVMIFDDIESQSVKFHIPFINKAQNISACLRSINNRGFVVKTLISLRAYTFRYHNSRQTEARRHYPDTNDVILKDTIPSIKSIFEKRFKVYEDNADLKQIVANEKRWKESKQVLFDVVNNHADFGDMISAIAHYDISHSLKLFLKVITNHKWFAPDEDYYQGSYSSLSSEHYPPIKERAFRALLYGEKDVFVDNEDNVLPNLLRVHKEESDSELVGLYILEYMKTLQRRNETSIYGFNRKKGKDICKELKNITSFDESVLTETISRLYAQEFLLHSIFEPETIKSDEKNNSSVERKYDEEEGLYLSIRGNKILDMLANDSLLFEVYRDDIDTELTHNTVVSSKLSQEEKLIYLINYCMELFEIEKSYIMNADKIRYFSHFNKKFIISRLVEGITNTILYYYKINDSKAINVKTKMAEFYLKIRDYAKELSSSGIDVDLSFLNDDAINVVK